MSVSGVHVIKKNTQLSAKYADEDTYFAVSKFDLAKISIIRHTIVSWEKTYDLHFEYKTHDCKSLFNSTRSRPLKMMNLTGLKTAYAKVCEVYIENAKHNVLQTKIAMKKVISLMENMIEDRNSSFENMPKMDREHRLSVYDLIGQKEQKVGFMEIYQEYKGVYRISDNEKIDLDEFLFYVDSKNLVLDKEDVLSALYIVGIG